jgi:predicted DNA-binding protein (UPF0251 family)
MKRLTSRAVLVGALLLAVVVVTGSAIAASGGVSPTGSSFLDSLAKHLGISRDKLDDAVQAAAVDQVDAALADGKITKVQADELKSKIESGSFPAFGFGFGLDRGFDHGPGHLGFGAQLDAAATYLGLTEDELRARLADGKSLKQIAEAEGKSVDGLKKALTAAMKEKLAQAVEDGDLTQAQADDILAKYTDSLDDVIAATFQRRGFGYRGFGPGRDMERHGFGQPSVAPMIAPMWGAPA